MKDRELLNKFLKNGWELRRVTGSHHHLFKDGKREALSVHNKEINPKLAKKIIDMYDLK